MRVVLQRLVQAEREFSLTFRKGKCGWTFQSPLPKDLVRKRLRKWCDRVLVIHAPSGKFFAQPSFYYFERALRPQSDVFAKEPVRSEKLRRLRPFLAKRGFIRNSVPGSLFRRIALRLDALPSQANPSALVRHLGEDFDELWSTVPLYKGNLTSFQLSVLRCLAG